jgi:hypothetical protein
MSARYPTAPASPPASAAPAAIAEPAADDAIFAEALARLVEFFERLGPDDVDALDRFYAPDARFKDPFNDVQGVESIRAIFAHMFVALEEPRFAVTGCVRQREQGFLTWDFLFRFRGYRRGETQTIRGATHVVLVPDGRVAVHRDYWDAAEELYEKLPLVGALMRWLRKRANT